MILIRSTSRCDSFVLTVKNEPKLDFLDVVCCTENYVQSVGDSAVYFEEFHLKFFSSSMLAIQYMTCI